MRKLFFIFLIIVSLLCPTACVANTDAKYTKTYEDIIPLTSSEIEVSYAANTAKVLKNQDTSSFDKNELYIAMAKNEYEGAQIVLSPNANISSYDLKVNSLYFGEEKIDERDIEVFAVEYIYVHDEGYIVNPALYSPIDYYNEMDVGDAIIPFDAYKKAGNNSLKKGENQSLYVKVKTTEQTVAGIYTGKFSLTFGTEKIEIPVKVNVWNFTVPDEVHTKSSFLIYPDILTLQEGNCSEELLKAYFDYFLEQRISLMHLPCKTMDYDSYLECLREYYDNPKLSAYALPYKTIYYFDPSSELLSWGYGSPDLDRLDEIIRRIVVMSHDDGVDYLEKAYIYNLNIDEFSYLPQTDQIYKRAERWADDFNSLIDKIESYFDARYGNEYLDGVPGLRHSLKAIVNVQVSEYVSGISDRYNNITSGVNYYHSSQMMEYYKEAFSGEYDELWWYTCLGPASPYPTYHISDPYSLLTARELSWMQYKYDIKGNLYYEVNAWHDAKNEWIDPYSDSFCYIWGDGQLVYPGSKYGIEGPIGSLRLEAIRDGLEEYEYLRSLSESCDSLSSYYETTINASDVASPLYDSLFAGTVSNVNFDAYHEARVSLANTLSYMQCDAKIVIEKIESAMDTVTATFLAAGDYTITTDNQTLTGELLGQGKRYSCTFSKDEDAYLDISATNGEKTYHYRMLIAREEIVLLDFNGNDWNNLVRAVGESTFDVETFDGRTVGKLIAHSTNDPFNSPKVVFDATLFRETVNNSTQYIFYLYNDYSEDVELSIHLITSSYKSSVFSGKLKAKQWNAISISDLSGFDQAQKLEFVFENKSVDGTPCNYNIFFNKCTYVGRGEL